MLAVLVAAMVSSGGYLALRLGRGVDEPGSAMAASATAPPASSGLSTQSAPHESDPGSAMLRAPQQVSAPPSSDAPKPVVLTGTVKPTPKRSIDPSPELSVSAALRSATAIEPPPAPAPVLEAPPQPRPAPPDRWQLMADAIARCSREDFISGVICEQRVRIDYCDGYWGQVAQCPSGISNDHGR